MIHATFRDFDGREQTNTRTNLFKETTAKIKKTRRGVGNSSRFIYQHEGGTRRCSEAQNSCGGQSAFDPRVGSNPGSNQNPLEEL